MESVPQEVQSLKKIPIIKASSCKYHNIVLARNGTLYSWGLNLGKENVQHFNVNNIFYLLITCFHIIYYFNCYINLYKGQMGHPAKYDIIKAPKRVSLIIQQDVIDVKTCVTASACLLSSYSVILLVNYTTQKLNFVIPPKPISQLTTQNFEISNRKSYLKKKNVQKTKITSIESDQNNHFIALSDSGDIYTWKVEITRDKSGSEEKKIPGDKLKQKSSIGNIVTNIGRAAIPGEIAYILSSKETDLINVSDAYLVYSTDRNYMKPLKIAIGIDGNILYSTKFGDVYFGVPKSKTDFKDIALKPNSKFYKFKKIPALQHIVDVFANSSGAYGAIRSDNRPKLIPITKGTLNEDISELYHSTANFIDKKLLIDGLYDIVFETSDNIYYYAHSSILAARSNFFYELFVLQQYKSNPSELNEAKNNNAIKELKCNNNNLKTEILHEELIQDIMSLIVIKLKSTNSNEDIYRNNIYIFKLKDIYSQSLAVLLRFIYSDTFDNLIMKQRYINSDGRKQYEDFVSLAKIFECHDTNNKLPTTSYKVTANLYINEEITQIHNYTQFDYSRQLERIWHDTGLLKLSDVILKLKNDVYLPVHRSILFKRCKFFEVILSPDSIWIRRDKKYDNKVIIDLSHVKIEIMSFILRYIYGDFGVEQFEHKFQKYIEDIYKTPCHNLEEYIELLTEVLILADELIIDELIDICSRLLSSILDVNNVVGILQISEKYNAYKLKSSCIQFICSNLITLIENGKIDVLDHEILFEIQESLQQLQNKKFKYTRGENSYYKRIKAQAEEETLQRKLKEKSKRQEKKNKKNNTNKEKDKGKEVKVEEELWQPSQEDIQEQILIYQLAMAEQEARKNANTNNNSNNNSGNKKKKKNNKGKESGSSSNSKENKNKELYDLSIVSEIQDDIAKNANSSGLASSSSSLDLPNSNDNINDSNTSLNSNNSKLAKTKKIKYSKLDLFSSESTNKGPWETPSPTNFNTKKASPIDITNSSPNNTTSRNIISPTNTTTNSNSESASTLAPKGWATLPNSNINNNKLNDKNEG